PAEPRWAARHARKRDDREAAPPGSVTTVGDPERSMSMQARMNNPATLFPEVMPAIQGLLKATRKGGVPKALLELVHLRVSQINGCSFCVDAGAPLYSSDAHPDPTGQVKHFSPDAAWGWWDGSLMGKTSCSAWCADLTLRS